MIKKTRTGLGAVGALALSTYLTGCAFVGGAMPNKSEVTIDTSTVDSGFKRALRAADRLAFTGNNQIIGPIAEYLESSSQYQVSLVSSPGTASPSQARRHLDEMCRSSERPNLVFFVKDQTSKKGALSGMLSATVGRSNFKTEWVTDALQCDSGQRTSLVATSSGSRSVFEGEVKATSQEQGHGFAQALLDLAR